MKYELLELNKLPQFHNTPVMGIASVAISDEKVVGFLCLQPVLHVEPLWISPEFRGKVNPVKLHNTLVGCLPKGTPYFAFVPDRKIALIAGSFGMKPRGWDVWEGSS